MAIALHVAGIRSRTVLIGSDSTYIFRLFESGQDYTIVSKDKDGKEKVEATVTTPKVPGYLVIDKSDSSVSIDTDTGAKYQVTKDGSESPGPGLEPEPEPREGTDDGKGCHAWAVLLVLVVYVAFLLLVHREGPFDLLTWAATIAALVIDAVVVALHGCAWDIAALVATIAVMGLAWYHFRGKPSSGDGEDRS